MEVEGKEDIIRLRDKISGIYAAEEAEDRRHI